MKQRNQYLDILRGLAAVLMVFGHCLQYGNGTEFVKSNAFFDNTFFALIYSFHMPLFMILSGYLFYYTVTKCRSHREFIINRCQRIMLPIISWQTIRYLFVGAKMIVNKEPTTPLTFVYYYVRSWFRDIWFLLAILYCSVIVYAVRQYVRDSIVVHCIIMTFCLITPDWIFINISVYKFMYPCFVCGYIYSAHEEKIKQQINRLSLVKWFGLFTLCFIILFLFWTTDAYIYTSGYTLLGRENILRQFSIDIYRLLMGFIGSAMVMLAVKILYNWQPDRNAVLMKVRWGLDSCQILVQKMGKESLCIYLLSSELVYEILQPYSDYFHFSYTITIMETIIFVFVCYWVSVGIGKVPWLNRILLGGR